MGPWIHKARTSSMSSSLRKRSSSNCEMSECASACASAADVLEKHRSCSAEVPGSAPPLPRTEAVVAACQAAAAGEDVDAEL